MNALFKKLNYKAPSTIYVLQAPDGMADVLKEMEKLAELKTSLAGARTIDFFLAFVTTQKQVDELIQRIVPRMSSDGVLWFAYPKRSSKRYSCNFNRDTGWALLGKAGYEGVRIVAVDEDWSALRFRKAENIKQMTRSFAMSEEGKKKVMRKGKEKG
jgi:hypothetical protein